MKYSFTENYCDIRKFEEFDEALTNINSKIKYDPEQFSEKSYNRMKENIQKLRDWAKEYFMMGIIIEDDTDDENDTADENGSTSNYGLSFIEFKNPCNIYGRVEIGSKFKEKNNIESCYPYAEFRISPFSFEIAVEGNVYRIYE